MLIDLNPWLRIYIFAVALIGGMYNAMFFIVLGVGDSAPGPDGMRHKPEALILLSLVGVVMAVWLAIDVMALILARPKQDVSSKTRVFSKFVLVTKLVILASSALVLAFRVTMADVIRFPVTTLLVLVVPAALPLIGAVLTLVARHRDALTR